MSVSLVAIMQNEAACVDRWIAEVRRIRGTIDEVLVVDGGSDDGTGDRLRAAGIRVVDRLFGGHFADQRNFAASCAAGDWIIELDADEAMSQPLAGGLRAIIADADRASMDCVGIARLNFIDGTHVAGPGAAGLDYQYRLHNRRCHWRGAVHEEIAGYRARYELKIIDGQFIAHEKAAARHAERNEFYKTLMP